MLSLLATGILIALGCWLFGSIVLRAGGVVLAVGGLLSTAMTGSPAMAAASLLGALAWLAGHWLFALRHHYFHSPLARRVFNDVLAPPEPYAAVGHPQRSPGAPPMSITVSSRPRTTTTRTVRLGQSS
jgi:hypothetical protein